MKNRGYHSETSAPGLTKKFQLFRSRAKVLFRCRDVLVPNFIAVNSLTSAAGVQRVSFDIVVGAHGDN